MPLKFKILSALFVSSWCLTPAFSQTPLADTSGLKNKKTQIYNASYNRVWDALQKVVGAYPLDYNDKKNGVIKTQKLGPKEIWLAPFEDPPPQNYKQILNIEVFRIGPRTTQVHIEKSAEAQMDFMGSVRQFNSSGWEEIRLFYRTQRHLDMDQVLRRIKIQ